MNMFLFCLVIALTVYNVGCSVTLEESEPQPEEDVCKLPPDSGKCEAYMPMFYYNSESGKCEKFIYGGCDGNGNRFGKKEDCQKKCAPTNEEDVCKLPKETGPCKAAMPRFYFNWETGTCDNFTYGGCGGNGNNFETEEECMKNCSQEQELQPEEDCCKLPPDSGTCYAYMPRFYYNSTSRTCEEFIYGGCGGNGNRFETKEDCEGKCGSSEECPKNQKYYDCKPICNTCEFYGKNIMCKIKCMEGCFCDEDYVMRKDDQCVKPEECSNETGETTVSPGNRQVRSYQPGPNKNMCQLPPETGPCRARISRFYYNNESETCEEFTYGGCDGNGNNFATKEECLVICGPLPEEILCMLPPETGPCRAFMRRFFYNWVTKTCEKFTYGGCDGNGNNFETKKACLKKCGKSDGVFL